MTSHEGQCVATTEGKLHALVDGNEAAPDGHAVRTVEHCLVHASFDGSLAIGVKCGSRIAPLLPQRRRVFTCTGRLKQIRLTRHPCFEARQLPQRRSNRIAAVLGEVRSFGA